MTVRTLSGATVTLVGRGADYADGDAIIPSFVDAAGTQYFLAVDANNPAGELPAIDGGVFNVADAESVLPFEVDSSRFILVNHPSSEYNSTSALVFAKRCGIVVSLANLILVDGESQYQLLNQPLTCILDVVQLTIDDTTTCACNVYDGWGDGSAGCVGCSFQPISSYEGNYVEGQYLDSQWDATMLSRGRSHNAWVFVLAGVPESVFAY